jgi:hypothetical protein
MNGRSVRVMAVAIVDGEQTLFGDETRRAGCGGAPPDRRAVCWPADEARASGVDDSGERTVPISHASIRLLKGAQAGARLAAGTPRATPDADMPLSARYGTTCR